MEKTVQHELSHPLVCDVLRDPHSGPAIRLASRSMQHLFCHVNVDFIKEKMNLFGLSSLVGPLYKEALTWVMEPLFSPPSPSLSLKPPPAKEVAEAAETLFGLLHSRFILTKKGLQRMEEKFSNHAFGVCPRVLCREEAVLPVGLSDDLHQHSVALFCPRCEEVYRLRSSTAAGDEEEEGPDGAYWGTSFPHLLLLYAREKGKEIGLRHFYEPRIFGLRVHKPKKEEGQKRGVLLK